MIRFFGFLAAFCLFANVLFSQDIKTLMRSGDEFFVDEQYRQALPFYESALRLDSSNAEALLKSGVCYLFRFHKDWALNNIDRAYQIDSTVDKHMHFWMGRAFHQNYMFDDALTQYNIYASQIGKYDQRQAELARLIQQTSTAQDMMSHPKNFAVRNMGAGFNTKFSEHSPVVSQQDTLLLFTSRRENQNGLQEEDGEPFEDIFMSVRNEKGEWSKPEVIQLNSDGHDASVQLYDNDSKLLLYKYHKGGDVYYTEHKGGNSWSDPLKFANVNTKDFESDAFITSDGKRAYFASNHYTKTGNLNIYFIEQNDHGHWGAPTEVKGKINTDWDEDAPFLSEDGKTMYFSSRGHEGMGGFDIYKSTLNESDNTWSEPENLGYPINTPDDDIYYYFCTAKTKAYLSSYRDGGFGEKDIYEIRPIYYLRIEGIVKEEGTEKPVSNLKLSVQSLDNTTIANSGESATDTTGTFKIGVLSYNHYLVTIKRADTIVKTDTILIPLADQENQVMAFTFYIPAEKKPMLDSGATIVASKDWNHTVYFRTGKYALAKSDKAHLDSAIAMGIDKIVLVELTGHTDDVGSDESNQRLSEKRAQAAQNYLIAKGLKPEQVSAKGAGEKSPIVPNDSAQNRAKNRRTEIKVTLR